MELRKQERLVIVNGRLMGLTIFAWWIAVLAISALIAKVMTEDKIQNIEGILVNIPVIEKYSHYSKPEYSAGLFYVVFMLVNPLIVFVYTKLITVRGVFGRTHKTILALFGVVLFVGLTIGFDVSSGVDQSFRGLFRLILGVSWIGPSLAFLILFHCLNFLISLMFVSYGRR